MKYDLVTIGDAMKDFFVFPAIDEMKKPVSGADLHYRQTEEKFLVLGYGDKITLSDSYDDLGGTACNVAASTSKLGLKTAMIAAYGKDDIGREIIQKVSKTKIDTQYLKMKNKPKSSFSIIISFKGERSILAYHGFSPQDFDIPKSLETEWIYVGSTGEEYEKLFSQITGMAAENNVKIAFNPGSVQIHDGMNALLGLLRVVDVLFLNKEEARALSGVTGLISVKETAKLLHLAGPKTVVITDGNQGAYVLENSEFNKVGVYPGHRVEATGAGDAFASAFLSAKIKGEDLLTCLKWGVTNSASVVEKYGAQQGLLSVATIKDRVEKYKWPVEGLRFS